MSSTSCVCRPLKLFTLHEMTFKFPTVDLGRPQPLRLTPALPFAITGCFSVVGEGLRGVLVDGDSSSVDPRTLNELDRDSDPDAEKNEDENEGIPQFGQIQVQLDPIIMSYICDVMPLHLLWTH